MTDIASRITTASDAKKLNQSQLARLLNLTPQAVQSWVSGKATPSHKNLQKLSDILDVSISYLLGNEDLDPTTHDATCLKVKIVDHNCLLGIPREDGVSSSSPLGYQTFLLDDLKGKDVKPTDALCLYLSGNSMQPVMPNRTLVCINQGDVKVVDGGVYAIVQQGEVRFKLAYRMPGAGLRLSSYNRSEHPDETYSASEIMAEGIEVKGRVFWMSQFL